jgi:CBS domain-containing protein
MRVSDVMTKRVISITPEATILEAIKIMLKNHISGMPVIDGKGQLVGIVTEGDFLHRSETGTERSRSRWLDALFGPSEAAKDFVHSHGLKVKQVMSRNPVTVRENTPLDEVVHLMENRNIRRLPVMRSGKVVGIVSRANLMHGLVSVHRGAPASAKTDAAIRDRILAKIDKQDWAYTATVDVVVRNGIADLWGTITDLAQREALKVLVENTPGVTRVEDHLRWSGEVMSVT